MVHSSGNNGSSGRPQQISAAEASPDTIWKMERRLVARGKCVLFVAMFLLMGQDASSLQNTKVTAVSSRGTSTALPIAFQDFNSWSNPQEVCFPSTRETKRRSQKYKRKKIPESEKETRRLVKERQAKYEEIVSSAKGETPSIWSFESLFPKPVIDVASVEFDLYEMKRRDKELNIARSKQGGIWKNNPLRMLGQREMTPSPSPSRQGTPGSPTKSAVAGAAAAMSYDPAASMTNRTGRVNYELTRMVEDKIYGYRSDTNTYETSLLEDGSVKFRDGVSLRYPLKINADRLNYYAKKDLRRGRVEEAQELFEKAVKIDPRDGRAYLGLSRAAQKRRDYKLAREWLKKGIAHSVSLDHRGMFDKGANPFILQALGVLEERSGNLGKAEALYMEATRSRPFHAASWVALGQLRTKKFRQGADAGRLCYESAERELQKAGLPPSSHVYTAWASLEYHKAGDVNRARTLFKKALEADPKCSAAWLQLGVMEANSHNWDVAQKCFETVLKFDQRNSRTLQAYAIMETKRPGSDSRKAIGLFEEALKVNPRDAGVLQPYALFVADLGDLKSARKLLRRATEVDKRHAPVWQAWGVLETRDGNPEEARAIFQKGIWACAQPSGGQSGGFSCARLWQAWGILESQEGDVVAARRCFSRALDADNRNVAAITAWARMEEDLGRVKDAISIYERFLKLFAPGTREKMTLWRSYELTLERSNDLEGAKAVYQRSMREALVSRSARQESKVEETTVSKTENKAPQETLEGADKFVAYSRRKPDVSPSPDVWMNDGAIEGKVPRKTMQLTSKKEKQ